MIDVVFLINLIFASKKKLLSACCDEPLNNRLVRPDVFVFVKWGLLRDYPSPRAITASSTKSCFSLHQRVREKLRICDQQERNLPLQQLLLMCLQSFARISLLASDFSRRTRSTFIGQPYFHPQTRGKVFEKIISTSQRSYHVLQCFCL